MDQPKLLHQDTSPRSVAVMRNIFNVNDLNTDTTTSLSRTEIQNKLKISYPKTIDIPSSSSASANLNKFPDLTAILSTTTSPRSISGKLDTQSNETSSHQVYPCKSNTNTTTCIITAAVSSSVKAKPIRSSPVGHDRTYSSNQILLNVSKSSQNTCIVQPFNYHSPVKTVAIPTGPCATTQVSSSCRRYHFVWTK